MTRSGAVAIGNELYQDLLKKVLTNTLIATEPNVNGSQAAYVLECLDHYIHGPAFTMLPLARMDNIQASIAQIIVENVPGDLIETGVWRGGATIFMRAILEAAKVTDRIVWVADSFEGLPEPDAFQFPNEARAHKGPVMRKGFRHFAASLEEVKANFEVFGLLDQQTRFLKGWFRDTLPRAPIHQLAMMRLDGDYYQSTMDALTHLYDKLSPGGFAIIDDYGEDEWTYCRQAVDEFRMSRGITDRLIEVDRRCFYWRRGS